MRKLRFHTEDSLDMLLDTLCDVFGSIILVSCLLALIGSSGPVADATPKDSPGVAAARQAADRRLKAAEEELRGLKNLDAKLSQGDNAELAKLAAERDALRQTQDRLRARQATPQAPQNSDSPEDIQALRREIRELERKIADAQAKRTMAELGEKDLLARLEQLKKLLREQMNKNVEYVRFPKEQEVNRNVAVLILKHGEMYPMVNAEGRAFPGLRRTAVEGHKDAFKATPIAGAGWDVASDPGLIREYLALIKRNGLYAAVHLYPDSFDLFRALRPYFNEAGVDFGFEILPQHYTLTFSPNGNKLKKL